MKVLSKYLCGNFIPNSWGGGGCTTAQPEIDLSKRTELKKWQNEWQSKQQSIWDRQKEELEQHRKNALAQLQIEPATQTESEEIEDYADILNQFTFQTPAVKPQQPEPEPEKSSHPLGWEEVTTQYEISFDSANSEESVSEKPAG